MDSHPVGKLIFKSFHHKLFIQDMDHIKNTWENLEVPFKNKIQQSLTPRIPIFDIKGNSFFCMFNALFNYFSLIFSTWKVDDNQSGKQITHKSYKPSLAQIVNESSLNTWVTKILKGKHYSTRH